MKAKPILIFVVWATFACTGGTNNAPVPLEKVEIPKTTPDLPPPPPPAEEPTAVELPPQEREATLPNHCTDKEVVVFSCKIEDKDKYVSLCRAPVLSSSEGHLVYRFGKKGDVELEYPKELVHPSKAFTYKSWSQSPRVSGWSVKFTNEDHKFDLHDAFFHGEQSNGLIIKTPTDQLIEFACEQPVDQYSSDITHVLPNEAVVDFQKEIDQLEADLKKNRHCLDEEFVVDIEEMIEQGREATNAISIMFFERDQSPDWRQTATCHGETK